MQNEIYVQYIHMVQSPKPEVTWFIKPGSLRPLCRSAVGRVLLSRKTDVEVQARPFLWPGFLSPSTPADRRVGSPLWESSSTERT